MKTEQRPVTDKDGRTVEARVLICPNCDNDSFNIFFIGEDHQHLQCIECLQSFCDGSCGNV
jgi:hypothetical protein